MSGTVKHSGAFDESVVDDRNERPLAIALATIVVVWSMAFALTVASGRIGAGVPSSSYPTAVMSLTGK